MLTHCFSTAESISEILLAGDAILNLSAQPLRTVSGTRFFVTTADGIALSELDLRESPAAVRDHGWLQELSAFQDAEVSRIVVVADEDCPLVDGMADALLEQGRVCLICTLMKSCDAEAFMDAEDTEAVTERLRQLGYI